MNLRIIGVTIILSSILFVMVACNKGTDSPQVFIPILITTAVTGITLSFALSEGNIPLASVLTSLMQV